MAAMKPMKDITFRFSENFPVPFFAEIRALADGTLSKSEKITRASSGISGRLEGRRGALREAPSTLHFAEK